MSAELAAGVMPSRARRPSPTTLFAEWDPVPIAAASIGQVHRAITHDGQAVAVKVQYPGVDEAIGADLDNVGLLFAGHGPALPRPRPQAAGGRAARAPRRGARLRASRRANQRCSPSYYAGHPTIHVPGGDRRALDPAGAHHRAGRRAPAGRGAGVGPARARPGRRDDLPLRVRQPLPARACSTATRTRATTCSGPAGTSRSSTSVWSSTSPPPSCDIFEDMIKAMVIEPRPGRVPPDRRGHRPAAARACPFTDEEVGDYFGHFYEFVQRGRRATRSPPSTRPRPCAGSSTPRGPYGEIMKAANVPPFMVIIQRINLGLYADLRRAPRHRQLAPPGRGAVAVRRRPAVDPDGRGHRAVAATRA